MKVYLDDKIKNYIIDIVFATREPAAYKLDLQRLIHYGASPRATLYLTLAAKARTRPSLLPRWPGKNRKNS
jgi:MoxR-like ATPase